MSVMLNETVVSQVRETVDESRLLDTATALVGTPSPTRSAGEVADRLASILSEAGFDVERPVAGYEAAPAVVARFDTGRPGRVLQFNGHLDTVHLPFVPPRIEGGVMYGSGVSDMKGGVAAAVEAMRVLRDGDLLPAGGVMLTAHDLHEVPWGDGSQVNSLIAEGYVGDAVLLPEYHCHNCPVVGRGQAMFQVRVTRDGEPCHEVLGGIDQPSVIAAGAKLIDRFTALDAELEKLVHPLAGRESLFVGQVHSGEMFNQSPTQLMVEGTRRWLPGTTIEAVREQFERILAAVADETGTRVDADFRVSRDAYEIAEDDQLVQSFQAAVSGTAGAELPFGSKPFVDDGNAFVAAGGVPAITHGPAALGAHTVNEECPVAELVRVAAVYALTAITFCATVGD
ncbi:MAG: M20/M25/M40 family metallo-hydrolase [Planctomycetota bacterium]|nr:M20/M25/M40 family metallo-hydrolase [Planctomycetota bacterium]MEE3363997.1 M20/M25/M40 family metallo-hydrolase [Planctomycetota bacterium]